MLGLEENQRFTYHHYLRGLGILTQKFDLKNLHGLETLFAVLASWIVVYLLIFSREEHQSKSENSSLNLI